MVKQLEINSSPDVQEVLDRYPIKAQKKLLALRSLILETAEEWEEIKALEECLKWGEPSYLVKKGSTIRMDWKAKAPDQYAMYFKCTSKLVPSFKAVYGDLFAYENNRAIVFQMEDTLPKAALKDCIKAALTYHRVKHLPHLGLDEGRGD